MSYLYKHKNGIWARKVELSDALMLKELKDESWYGTHRIAFLNLYDEENWIVNVSADPRCLYMIAAAEFGQERKPVGIFKYADIDTINRSAIHGHDVFEFARGKGFGNTVLETSIDFGFELLNLHRIDAWVLENNTAALKNVKYVGFVQEGCRRRAVWKCGRWLDSLSFGITREDWEQLERVKQYGGLCNISFKLCLKF